MSAYTIAGVAWLTLCCLFVAVLLFGASSTPTEPTYAAQRERAAMRQELRTELVRQAVAARAESVVFCDLAAWEIEQAAWFDAGQPMGRGVES